MSDPDLDLDAIAMDLKLQQLWQLYGMLNERQTVLERQITELQVLLRRMLDEFTLTLKMAEETRP